MPELNFKTGGSRQRDEESEPLTRGNGKAGYNGGGFLSRGRRCCTRYFCVEIALLVWGIAVLVFLTGINRCGRMSSV